MTHSRQPARRDGLLRAYLSFLGAAVLVLGILSIGAIPTRRWVGEPGLAAMAMGCAISLVAALVGSLPIALARRLRAPETVSAILQSIALRLTTVILLGWVVAQSGRFEETALLLWLVISHSALLLPDGWFVNQVLYRNPVGPAA